LLASSQWWTLVAEVKPGAARYHNLMSDKWK
jgi:hypothetical protein